MDGRIHMLVIHRDGEEYRWSVDEDHTNYTFLCTDICQDVLRDDYSVRTVSLTITGLVKGYENSFIVKDDASWMSLLGKNVDNKKNVIHLFVNIEEFLTNEFSPPRVARCGPSCTINEIDEDADKVKTGDAIVPNVGEQETKLSTTIVISDSESDDFFVNDDGIGTAMLRNSQIFESENVEVSEFYMSNYENVAATELNMGDYENVAAAEFNMGDYENVVATKLNMGDYENVAATESNMGASEYVESFDVHMDFDEEFVAFTDFDDDEIDVDESDSKDPNFKRVDWESSIESESFGSFIDKEIDNEVNQVEQHNEEVEEIVEKARVKSDNEGEVANLWRPEFLIT